MSSCDSTIFEFGDQDTDRAEHVSSAGEIQELNSLQRENESLREIVCDLLRKNEAMRMRLWQLQPEC